MPEWLITLNRVAHICLILMATILVAFSYTKRKTPGAKLIGILWLLPVLVQIAYWIVLANAK